MNTTQPVLLPHNQYREHSVSGKVTCTNAPYPIDLNTHDLST